MKFAPRLALLAWTVAITYAAVAQTHEPPTTYIAFSAKLDTLAAKATIAVNGVTNLPPGSVLRIEVDDYRGYRSTIFNENTEVTVGSDGRFAVSVPPKSGLSMRANLQCSVAFFPNWNQPANVIHKFGKRGENLVGPQTAVNSGGTYLDAVTVVTD